MARRSLGDRARGGAALFDTRVEFPRLHFGLQNRNSLRCAERSSVCECRDCVNPNSEESIDIAEELRRTELRDDCNVDCNPMRPLTSSEFRT